MSLVVSLFCPLCQDPYDELAKRPRFGTCRHTVCHTCIESSGSIKCPICHVENSFTNAVYNFQLEFTLLRFKELTIEELRALASNPGELSIGVCNGARCAATERLRMCMTCGETSRLFKKLPNGKFEILETKKLVFLSKATLFCSDCIADGLSEHTEHEFLPLSKIDVINVDLEFWYYMVHAISMDKKMKKDQYSRSLTDPDLFIEVVLQLKREAIYYEALFKSGFSMFLEIIRVSKYNSVDIYSIPELAEAKEKSVEKAKKVIDRIKKVQQRQLMIKRERLKDFVEGFKIMVLSAEDPVWKAFMDEITDISNQFNSFECTNLTNSEAAYIDQRIDAKMAEAIQKLGLPGVAPKKFLMFKALCNILQEASDNKYRLHEPMFEEADRFHEFFYDRMNELEGVAKEDKLTLKLILYELTEQSFLVDKAVLDVLEGICDFCEGRLLWVRYFSATYDSDPKERIYTMMLEERFSSDDDFLTKLFSLSLL